MQLTLPARPETIKRVEGRHGRATTEKFIQEFNTARIIEVLTEKQARTSLRPSALDSLRDRILTQAQEANIGSDAWKLQTPLSVKNTPEVKYSRDGRVEGFTLNGKVCLVDGNIRKDQAMKVLSHELGVHAKKLGVKESKQFQRILAMLQSREARALRLGAANMPVALRSPLGTS